MKLKPELNRQHVLLKPEHYLGDLKEVEESVWVVEKDKMVFKKIKYIPALLKLYDEILINAAQRKLQDTSTAIIHITVTNNKDDSATITVLNDGRSISTKKVGISNQYLVYSIFGNEKTPEQYERLGYSVKLVNIFSKHFYIETGVQNERVALKVEWTNNMQGIWKQALIPYENKDYTKVGFTIDMERLGLKVKKISQNLLALMERRAYDIAGLLRVKVRFNNKYISFQNFSQYAKMFVKDEALMFYDKEEISPRWNVILAKSSNIGYQHLTFVNSCIWTRRGGTHADSVLKSIADKAMLVYNKRFKDPDQVLKKQKLHSSYMLFVSFYIEEPEFQTPLKDRLISPIIKFESVYTMSDEAFEFLEKHKLLEVYKEIAMQRENKKATNVKKREADKSKLTLPRLEEAPNVGVSSRCTLIIVQNQASKNLLMNGFQYVSKAYHGILSLKSKLPNVRDMSTKQLLQNQDFSTIIKVLGLSIGKVYDSLQGLRYSSVLIAIDPDEEGISTKGLLLNFFDTFWPSLFKIKGYLKLLLLPAIRCVNSLGLSREFLSEEQYWFWKSTGDACLSWTISKYKGLGSMSIPLIRDLLTNPKKWIFNAIYKTPLDQQSLRMFYSKKGSEKKKKFLQEYKVNINFSYSKDNREFSIKDFVYQDLMYLYYQEHHRVTPNCVDGVNMVQRKALTILMAGATDTVVSLNSLTGKIMEESICEFGESVIHDNLITLGQNYVGSNNISLIEPVGQFGSRYLHGKDSAPPKQLSASIPLLTKLLFPEQDIHVLQYQQIQGKKQANYLLPILPVILINGCRDNNMTWSNTAFGRRVLDVIDMTKGKLQKGSNINPPSWQGYKGSVQLLSKGCFSTKGCLEVRGRHVRISEIPINKSVKQFKTSLEEHLPGQKGNGTIESIKESHRGNFVQFILKFQQGKIPRTQDLQGYLKISSNLVQNNIVLLNPEGKFQRYENAGLILNEYYQVRLKAYEKRKEYLVSKKIRQIEEIRQKIRFIKEILSGEFHLGESEEVWENKFNRKGYKKYKDLTKIKSTWQIQTENRRNYEHLYTINIQDFNEKRLKQLREEQDNLDQSLALLKKTDEKAMWLKDISTFQEHWKACQRKRDEIDFQLNKRPDKIIKQPSEPSLNKRRQSENLPKQQKKRDGDMQDLSLDSQQLADLQKSKTQQIPEQQKNDVFDKKRVYKKNKNQNTKDNSDQKLQINYEIYKKGGIDLETFSKKLAIMERKNMEYRQRTARDKNREIQLQEQRKQKEKMRIEKEMAEKKKKKIEDLKKGLNPPKPNGQQTREDMANAARRLTQKLEQQKRVALQNQQVSQQSERNHLPKPTKIQPPMTVPYDYKEFTVNHVYRKRFSTRQFRGKSDEDQIHRIQAEVQREDILEKMKKNETQCINLDD